MATLRFRNTKNTFLKLLVLFFIIPLIVISCRDENEIYIPDEEEVTPGDSIIRYKGFYLLNEGNMGSNKSTLDYFDFKTGVYTRNIYSAANPTVPKELGDVGNDLKIYGKRLYAVINCSNKIEVMHAENARRIGQINIPNCRYIQFHEGYAYVTSYAGPVEINPGYEQIGYVAKVDTATLQVVVTCTVGFQPDELEIVDDKIYVANSGGYMVPNYENTVSVIDMATFKEEKRIEVAINLHRLRADTHGNLWVASRGDYEKTPSALYWIDIAAGKVGGKIDIPVSGFHLDGDSLYTYSTGWSNVTMENTINYAIVDVTEKKVVNNRFITDGTEKNITYPYGLMVHPYTKDIYMTDAFNHVYPGALFCFGADGVKKWEIKAGDLPAHFALLPDYEN